ncbi:GNAT family N-acetyltransferase [Streptomyces chattanoogensis]|uniref:Acetyltransferase n=1 Tax=Streptomyces chattanoogensis TaxID=66876 RepID=A0A0N0Y240_9ACTN|nr:GNAT family N-acetyltransferase [Streptomyces chattanoogensis]KPC67098.1 acetyltransferase [Streptomyces chattanoogensis]
MIIRAARERDVPGFLEPAAQVEHWSGPMAGDPGFRAAVDRHIGRSTALVAVSPQRQVPLGGLLFSVKEATGAGESPTYHVRRLVVAERARGRGVGRALPADALRRFVRGPGTVEVITFGPDHPGAVASAACAFYEALGFAPAEAAGAGPECGSRQMFRMPLG